MAKTTFENVEIKLKTPDSKIVKARTFVLQEQVGQEEIPEEVENAVTPLVWPIDIPRKSKVVMLVKIPLKPSSKLVRQKKISNKTNTRIKLIDKFL